VLDAALPLLAARSATTTSTTTATTVARE
jgi:hypothetical protein